MTTQNLDQFFTFEARLGSFQKTTKKRGSTAGGRGTKALNWPHKQISPANLARAGFYFRPTPENPDNTVCFLCEKGLDGWEAGDDPVLEHVKHAPHCGWAVVAAIEADIGDFGKRNPSQDDMFEAREATFAGKWPHDGKKGWKCKTKQLVEAGWKYTPTADSDDMATCAYCQLALDGWEPNDKPLDEHYNRSPNCPFFQLVDQFKGSSKKGKGARTSKSSRLSAQSIASEATDVTASLDDSVLTTASLTAGGKKPRAKKTTAGKGSRKKTKKEESSEVLDESRPIEPEETSQVVAPAKTKRGKKRTSDAIDESIISTSEGPATKRQVTRTLNSPDILEDDSMMSDAPPLKSTKSKSTKKAQELIDSHASMASLRAPPGSFPDDDEIERQLEADLERQLSEDDEIEIHASPRPRTATSKASTDEDSRNMNVQPNKARPQYAMFDPSPPTQSEADLDDELRALQAEMEMVTEAEAQLHKKSREVASKKGLAPKIREKTMKFSQKAQQVEIVEAPASTTTNDEQIKPVVTAPKRGRGRPSKTSLASQDTKEIENNKDAQPPVKRGRGRPSKSSLLAQDVEAMKIAEKTTSEAPAKRSRGRPAKKASNDGINASKNDVKVEEDTTGDEEQEEDADDEEQLAQSRRLRSSSSPVPRTSLTVPPSTPPKAASPTSSAQQAVPSPSQSPQSSDAENQEPSTRPATAGNTKRVVLAPVAATTPSRGSPSKRNVVAGLKSSTQWTATQVDAIFGSPKKGENENDASSRFLRRGKELSSPEKQMTVEEWIYFNANEAEKQLKHECESLVSRFESEGSRAIRVLEGLEVE